MIIAFLLVIFLLWASAFFSASETAYSSVNKVRLKTMADKGNYLAGLALNLANDFDRLLASILIGNNLVNIALTAVLTMALVKIHGAGRGALLSTVIATPLVIFFGEITPKSIAREYPEKFALSAAFILWAVRWVLWPVNILFSFWKAFLAKMMNEPGQPRISQEELLMLVDEAQSDGGIDKDEGVLLKNALKFTECPAEDIITHRVDIAAVPVDATREEVAAKFMETEYSRLPVYSESLDNIVGILGLKDFFASMTRQEPWNLKNIVTPPFFVQKTEKIDDVLKKLQSTRSQIAVVLDEFGGTLGLLSVEDIVEELVGEIWDEHDEVVEKFKKLSEDAYSVDCTVSLDDFQEFFQVKLDSDESLLGGWILEQLHKLPQKGDHCAVENLEITISSCTRYRVRRVYVKVHPPVPESGEEGMPESGLQSLS